MKPNEVRAELAMKTIELDKAMEAGIPQVEVMKIYKELKELQFQLLQEQMLEENENVEAARISVR